MSSNESEWVLQLPEGHKMRRDAVSAHRRDEGCDVKHIYLKCSSGRVNSKVSTIGDVDIMIENPEKMAAAPPPLT